MAVPTPASQVREAIAHILKLMPDLFIDMKRVLASKRSTGPATIRSPFVEWRRGDVLGVDRLDLKDGAIASMRRNFDTLGLLAERDPSVTALRAALLSNTGR